MLAAFVERYALVGAWLLVIAGFGIALPGSFLTWQNFAVMFASQAPAALLALALIVPLTCGDYDLSGGAVVTLAAVILGVLNVVQQQPIGLALAVALAAGVLVGAVNAFFIVYVRIPSLVVTLGTASLVTGFVQWFSDSSTISGLDATFVDWIIIRQLFGISYAFYVAVLVALLLWYVFEYTPLGRRMLFVGKSREGWWLTRRKVTPGGGSSSIFSSALAAAVFISSAGSTITARRPPSGAERCRKPASRRTSSTVITVFNRLLSSSQARRRTKRRPSEPAWRRRATPWAGSISSVSGVSGAPPKRPPPPSSGVARRNRAIRHASVALPTPRGPVRSQA